MKNITFNQLQLRLLTLLFVVFTSAIFGYRYIVELPKLEHNISILSERELDTLTLTVTSKLDALSRMTFDYAVWTSSYDFMKTPDEDYIEENMVDNTFISLEIDGIFYLNEHLQPILERGFHHKKLTNLEFSFYDFNKYHDNLAILPEPSTKVGAPKKVGFIDTLNGPAMYSAIQVRDSNLEGEYRGYIIMVQLLENSFINELSKFTLTDISFLSVTADSDFTKSRNWDESNSNIDVKPHTDVLIRGVNGNVISVLRMKHRIGSVPPLVNEQSIIFIIVMSVFIYSIYHLVLNTIIVPVKKLALDIKVRDNKENNKEKYSPLDEQYRVSELSIVTKNINQLMQTIQQQKDRLSDQANTDQLTQIMNRHALMQEFDRHRDLCIRKNIGFTLIMVDIDHFKAYNDTLGHLEGDTALRAIADTLNQQCKRIGDVCARYGGEEFTLIFSEMSDDSLYKKLNRVMKAIHDVGLLHPCSPTADFITISMGAAIVKGNNVIDFNLSKNDVFKVADNALYEAKNAGRNGFVVKTLSTEV